jgi:hypothetical protein
MPIQAHVAVLLQLRKLFSGAGSPESPRAPRRGMLGDKMEVLVGAQEILAALGPRKPEARRLTPRNASATGYLFVTSDKATEDIAVGTLLGLRVDPREPPVLGRVVRRVHEVDDGWHLGVEVLSDPSVPIRAASLESDGGKSHDLVFVPGSDRSGRFDSFAVDYGLLGRHERYRLRAGAAVYSLAFNRVRRRGRDWALAGFEILEAATA